MRWGGWALRVRSDSVGASGALAIAALTLSTLVFKRPMRSPMPILWSADRSRLGKTFSSVGARASSRSGRRSVAKRQDTVTTSRSSALFLCRGVHVRPAGQLRLDCRRRPRHRLLRGWRKSSPHLSDRHADVSRRPALRNSREDGQHRRRAVRGAVEDPPPGAALVFPAPDDHGPGLPELG